MSMIIRNNVRYAAGGGNLNIVKLTQAEYDALPDSKYSDGILYAIEDGEISSTGGSAKAITISQEDFDKLSEEEKASGIYVIPEGEDLTAKNLFYDGSVTGLGNTVQDAIDNLSEQNKKYEYEVISQEDFIESVTKGTISSVDIKKYNNKIIGIIYFTGTISPSAGNNTKILTIKEQYRPKITQCFACLVNTASSSGQTVASSVGTVISNGEFDVCFPSTNTHGNSNYPWSTTAGLKFSYEL